MITRSIVRDALIAIAVVWLLIVTTTTAFGCSRPQPTLTLEGVCQADEDLWVFTARSTRTGTIEISWQQDFSFVFDTVDLRKSHTEVIYTGQPDTGSVTLFARYVGRPGIRAEAELSERPCTARDAR